MIRYPLDRPFTEEGWLALLSAVSRHFGPNPIQGEPPFKVVGYRSEKTEHVYFGNGYWRGDVVYKCKRDQTGLTPAGINLATGGATSYEDIRVVEYAICQIEQRAVMEYVGPVVLTKDEALRQAEKTVAGREKD